ncbi:hypothetical protein [Halotalea alkalilenta]|uniref:Uncharacterized protein n=1 Tax=Halotalea alkalilenta TaxID=376489 RepID=A0A172YGV6_9GAMM|nr:hypothetical protein [Halotalea alkalilenta]ANF58346.1 hypothetical protein A5892_13410 [Halotalea alkalilenta]
MNQAGWYLIAYSYFGQPGEEVMALLRAPDGGESSIAVPCEGESYTEWSEEEILSRALLAMHSEGALQRRSAPG